MSSGSAAFTLLADPLDILKAFPQELVGFMHHKRKRIKEEAPAIVRAGKGRPEDVFEQLAAYQADGWDTDESPQRLITNGGFLLRRHTPKVCEFNDRWHHEVQTRSLRDQMSIDYCAHKVGLPIAHFPGTVRRNPFAILNVMRRKPTNDF